MPIGMATAGCPVVLAGMVSAPLLPSAASKPSSEIEVDPVDRRGHRTLRPEGHVGVGGADDEVGLLEDLRHLHDHGAPERLDVLRRLDAEVVGGDVGGQHDLGRELVLALGVPVPEADQQAGRPGHGPFEATPGQRDGHVDLGQLGVPDQELGRLLHLLPAPADATTAAPRSTQTTARNPCTSWCPSPASQPETRGRE